MVLVAGFPEFGFEELEGFGIDLVAACFDNSVAVGRSKAIERLLRRSLLLRPPMPDHVAPRAERLRHQSSCCRVFSFVSLVLLLENRKIMVIKILDDRKIRNSRDLGHYRTKRF